MNLDNVVIRHAKNTGGKAGKGCNKTSTLQVVELFSNGAMLLKQFRYTVNDIESYYTALDKARGYVKTLRSAE